MGFRDLFQKTLQEEHVHAADVAVQRQEQLVQRTGLLAEAEPKLQSLALAVYGVLEEAGIPPIPVWPMSPYVRNHVAFALAPLTSLGSSLPVPIAAVVVDCQGMIAFHHRVKTTGEWPHKVAKSTDRLDEAYEQVLRGITRTETPESAGIYITPAGELRLCTESGGWDKAVYISEPLEVFLARHAAKTVASRT